MRVGFVAGAFDLLHAGHIHLLKQCRKNCDYLVVGVHVDPSIERNAKNKPIESVLEREIKLNACKYVDLTVAYETEADLSIILKYFKIDIRFLGSDYAHLGDREPIKKEITDEGVIPIQFIESIPLHSADIRKRIKNL